MLLKASLTTLAALATSVLASPAWAQVVLTPTRHTVPEVSSAGSLAAIVAVAALAAVLFERRRRA